MLLKSCADDGIFQFILWGWAPVTSQCVKGHWPESGLCWNFSFTHTFSALPCFIKVLSLWLFWALNGSGVSRYGKLMTECHRRNDLNNFATWLQKKKSGYDCFREHYQIEVHANKSYEDWNIFNALWLKFSVQTSDVSQNGLLIFTQKAMKQHLDIR